MPAHFLDSSVLVKRYIQETGTAWVRSLTHRRTGNQIFLARIAIVELTSAIARRRGGRTITSAQAASFLSRFRKHLAGRYTILEMTVGLLDRAAGWPTGMTCLPMMRSSSRPLSNWTASVEAAS